MDGNTQSLNSQARMMQSKFPELYRCVTARSSNNNQINKQANAFDIITDAMNDYRGNKSVTSLISLAVVTAGGTKGKMCYTNWVEALKNCQEYMPSKF